MRRMHRSIRAAQGALLACLLAAACSGPPEPPPVAPPVPVEPGVFPYRIVQVFPHDPRAFTQGLLCAGGVLYEGTGQHGLSSLREVELESGRVLRQRDLDERFHGEGLTLFEDRLIQLTWRSNVGFVYDRESFELLDEFRYPTEGWGITHDGQRLIMSDGTADLHFLDPETFLEIGRLQVRQGDQPIRRLNELEFVDGEIYANVWGTDRIVRIAPSSGQVVGWIDLQGLLTPEERARADVLNGIAYDAAARRLFVTGKWWPKLFEIELVPRAR